jgi:hypothetical protein
MKTIVHILILLSLVLSTGLKPIQHLIEDISIDINMDENGNEESAEEKDLLICTYKISITDAMYNNKSLFLTSANDGPTKILIPSFTGNDVLNPPEQLS